MRKPQHGTKTTCRRAVVINILQSMHIVEVTAFVTLNGMAYLVVVGVFVVVFRCRIDNPGTRTPVLAAIRKTQKLVIGSKGAYTLYIL